MMERSTGVVFADVDDTLIRHKSLLGFAKHVPRSEAVLSELLQMLNEGVPREEVNRLYYERFLCNRDVAETRRLAQQWYAGVSVEPRFFKWGIIAFLHHLRARGYPIVLVTGSFHGLVDPIAELVGAQVVLGAPLEEVDGRYTGRLQARPTIGIGKAEAVRGYAIRVGVDLNQSYGIGDDFSDRYFLDVVGFACVPSDGASDLLELAAARSWRIVDADG